MPEGLTQSPRRIEVWNTVVESYRTTFTTQALRMPYVGVPIVLQILAAWTQYHMTEGQTDPKVLVEIMKTVSPGEHILSGVIGISAYLSMLALSVSWQRYLVRGEQPSGAYLGAALWRYIGYMFLLILVAIAFFLPAILIGALSGHGVTHRTNANGHSGGGPLTLVAILFGLIAFVFVFRACFALVPKLVAVVVDNRPFTWQQSFVVMRGNKLRLFGAMFLMSIPLYVVMGVVLLPSMLASLKPDAAPQSMMHVLVMNGLLYGVFVTISALLSASLYALVYKQVVPATAPVSRAG